MNFFKITRLFLVLLLSCAMLLCLCACGKGSEPKPSETSPSKETVFPTIGATENSQTAFLGDNLYITDIGPYTGAYMEDGKNEFVTDMMMIILKNENEEDLQLVRISLEYSDFTAEFEATNLPAGESVVLLEKNKHEYVDGLYHRATASNIAFFQEPMNLQADKVKLTGGQGGIIVENLTDEALGEIYIYYKNSAADLFYGGITYFVRLEAGLKPGRSMTAMTSHYHPDACEILNVNILPVQE